MNIKQTIGKINQKPDYVRIRYVWGSVIFCMSLILLVFSASIKQTFRMDNMNSNNIPAQIGTAEPSITEIMDEGKDIINNWQDIEDDYNYLLSGNASTEEIKEILGGNISEEEIQELLNQQRESSESTTMNTRSGEHQDNYSNQQPTYPTDTNAPKNTLPIAD